MLVRAVLTAAVTRKAWTGFTTGGSRGHVACSDVSREPTMSPGQQLPHVTLMSAPGDAGRDLRYERAERFREVALVRPRLLRSKMPYVNRSMSSMGVRIAAGTDQSSVPG